ncbi:MAG: ATP-binding protein [Phenylobacterium sp.]|uniref:ATP-binding protein n=1 Tax=Phenylobacterium sp. TaxID=1871053 RepID=UPI002735BD1F|nr:ATP-binding protein [Phenylobacterium sp.]MDP3747520.1 ATP-binding protein [Phenylobacterium sp.]
MLRPEFDAGLDAQAREGRETQLLRLSIAAVFGGLLALNFSWVVAAIWFGAVVIAEAWAQLSYPRGVVAPLPRHRVMRLAAIAATSIVWTAMPIAYWSTGIAELQIVAVALLFSLLVIAQTMSFHSAVATLAFGTAPTVALLILPIVSFLSRGTYLLTLVVVLLLGIVYLILDIRRNVFNATTLRHTQAELITRQHALEEQTERAVAANHAKTAFLAMMSHELRTPMNGVLGMAHALTHTDLNSRQADHVDMLLRSGGGLMSILNDLLDTSKIEAGKLELESIPFDLEDLGRRVYELWTETASAKGVRLVFDVDQAAPRWVLGDPTRLRQIMVNLISNALKFTTHGEVRLSIWSEAPEVGSPLVSISVSDSGLGISDEQKARLFQSFAQADASTNRRFGGTGLGLAICRNLATLMGGDIVLDSRPGEGSTFTVTLPLIECEALEETQEEEAPVNIEGLTVLVADDNAINQAVARAILEAFGVLVITAGDGAIALDCLRTTSVDVVLMDIHMPGMDGPEALSRIRAGEAGRRDQPVVALTADAMAGVDEQLMAHGFNAVEPKPINPSNLIATIARLATPDGQAASGDEARVA